MHPSRLSPFGGIRDRFGKAPTQKASLDTLEEMTWEIM